MTTKSSASLSFWEHVAELRLALLKSLVALFVASFLAFLFRSPLFALVLKPLLPFQEVILLGPLEGIKVSFLLSFWTGLLVASPLILFFLLHFLFPALTTLEKKLSLTFIAALFLVMGLATTVSYTFSLPLALSALQRFNTPLGTNLWTLTHCFQFILGLAFVHVVALQFFFSLLLLIHFHILSYPTLKKARRYSYVAIFIVAALITPPDLLTQCLLAFPLLTFYEGATLYARLRTPPTINCQATSK